MRRRAPRIGFGDMPKRLVEARDDQAKREQLEWLERHGLGVVDYFGWLRSQNPRAAPRPPSRRKFMSAKELAELDARREQEGEPKW
jgi:hypothetical protein